MLIALKKSVLPILVGKDLCLLASTSALIFFETRESQYFKLFFNNWNSCLYEDLCCFNTIPLEFQLSVMIV